MEIVEKRNCTHSSRCLDPKQKLTRLCSCIDDTAIQQDDMNMADLLTENAKTPVSRAIVIIMHTVTRALMIVMRKYKFLRTS